MQEHEYVYEHELEQIEEYHSGQESEPPDDLSGQALLLIDELTNEEVVSEVSSEAYELEAARDQRATLRLGRGLAIGLGLSFLACLAALWLSSTLLSAPDQVLPLDFLQMLAANRILVLCVPVIFLVICYIGLRSLTAEIMAVPERNLDERQKMLRDQAHRSAFKVIKFSSVLIPVAFVLPHLPWFNPVAPVVSPPGILQTRFAFSVSGNPAFIIRDGGFMGRHFHGGKPVDLAIVSTWQAQAAPLIQPASTLAIVLAGGLLLLSLVLMVSALPMAALAWKGKA